MSPMRLIWLVLASTLCVGLACSWISARAIGRLTRLHAEAALPASLMLAQREVDAWYQDQERAVTRALTDPDLIRATRRAREAPGDAAFVQDLEDRLRTTLKAQADWSSLISCAASSSGEASAASLQFGRVLASAGAALHLESLSEQCAEPMQRSPEPAGELLIGYAAPRKLDGSVLQPVAVDVGAQPTSRWVVLLDLSTLAARLRELPQGLPTTLALLDAAGQRVLETRPMPLHAVQALSSYRSEDGQPVLGVRRALEERSGWLVAESAAGALIAPAQAAAATAMRALLVVLVLSLCGAVYLTRSLARSREELESQRAQVESVNAELRAQNDELHRLNDRLERLSITDGLTQLHNHRFFQEQLTREILRAARATAPLMLVLMDIDHFKQLNDRYGHAVGDSVLRRVAETMRSTTRPGDLLARYGGEEFALVPRQVSLEGAIKIAEKIRLAVARLQFPDVVGPGEDPSALRVTLSVGIAAYLGDRARFFEAADRALYQAKANGRDCVCIDADAS